MLRHSHYWLDQNGAPWTFDASKGPVTHFQACRCGAVRTITIETGRPPIVRIGEMGGPAPSNMEAIARMQAEITGLIKRVAEAENRAEDAEAGAKAEFDRLCKAVKERDQYALECTSLRMELNALQAEIDKGFERRRARQRVSTMPRG